MKPRAKVSRLVLCLMMTWAAQSFPEALSSSSSMASSEDIVVAKLGNGIQVTKLELDRVLEGYRRKNGKVEVGKKEKIDLLEKLVHRRLILEQESIEGLRKDPEIVKQVKEYEDNLVIVKFLVDRIGDRVKVTDEEMAAFYEKNPNLFLKPRRVEASNILLRTREEAEQVLSKVRQGEDFAQLAKDYSIDLPKARDGGKMGVVELGKLLPEIENAISKMQAGEVSDIVKTGYGYQIIKVHRVFLSEPKPFGEVKDKIRMMLVREKKEKAYEDLFTQLENGEHIVIFEDRIGD
jgi:parvulin-like peptidyl-prolyl isomerase